MCERSSARTSDRAIAASVRQFCSPHFRYSVGVIRKSALWIILAVLVLAAIVIIPTLPKSTDIPAPSDLPNTAATHNTVTIARPANATLSHVAYVHDGDTLYLQPDGTTSRADEITVRLIGLDTPELRPTVGCFALEARDYLRSELPEGTAVWIAADRQPLDQYGRSLLYLWTTDDRSVNLDLVSKGYATALNIAPSNTYWKQFEAAESAAHDANLGLWGSC